MRFLLLVFIPLTLHAVNAQILTEEFLRSQVDAINADLVKQNEILSAEIKGLNDTISVTKDSALMENYLVELTNIWEKYDDNLVQILKNDLAFAQQNPTY